MNTEVAVTTAAGDNKVIEVPHGSSALHLRKLVAESWGVSLLETTLIDNTSGTPIFFGDSAPLEPLPTDLLFVRSQSWSGVPDGFHHSALNISENRLQIEHSAKEKSNEACFLTSALEVGYRYTLHCRIGGGHLEGGFIGVVRDTMMQWDYLKGLWILVRKGQVYNDDFSGSRGFFHAGDFSSEAFEKACADGFVFKMVLDTRGGSLELWNGAGDIIFSHAQKELAGDISLRFAASFFNPGISIEILDAQME